ncbi:MAG: NPCBM/NEW2 domain-containing protein [Defluviitaleaceae bacterium]|nr:NPCBM/NEW2 domain-containing protein [Defluviitaleaceae bacterium]
MKNSQNAGIKGFFAGFILCALLSISVIAFADGGGLIREIFFGVRVEFNGDLVDFEDDMRPFIMDGRTYLSVRAMADVLGLRVDWDDEAATVIVGHRGAIPLLEAAPAFESRFSTVIDTVVTIDGEYFDNSISINFTGVSGYSYHHLAGGFTRFSALIGSDDSGVGAGPVSIRIYGDGELLGIYEANRGETAIPIMLDVTGVEVLRIFGSPQSLTELGRAVITNMQLQ